MTRNRHPKREIETALKYAESKGWRIKEGGSHAWGRMYCPYQLIAVNKDRCRCGEFCISSIWSTPKNTVNHARQIRRVVDNCSNVIAFSGKRQK